MTFGPVGLQPRRRLARSHPALERRAALPLRRVTANPVDHACQLPRRFEVRPGVRGPDLRRALRAGQVLALPVELLGIVSEGRTREQKEEREEGANRVVHGSPFMVHGSRVPVNPNLNRGTLNREP